MNRLGGSILHDLPLLDADEVMARVDAVTLDDLRSLTDELWRPSGCPPPASARRGRVPRRRRGRLPGRGGRRGMIRGRRGRRRGAHGPGDLRGGRGADDLELAGRADPALGRRVADVLGDCDVLVDFTRPTRRSDNAARRSAPACTS
jgi:hypothetical protein